MEEVPQHKTKDLDYYLRNDRTYTQAEKEEYKRLKAQENLQTLQDQQWQRGDWEYHWNANGSLKSVKLPDGEIVSYEYDALGRRTKKLANGKIKRYLWDGNVLLHEWEYNANEQPRRIVNKLGEVSFDKPEPINNLITWVYETGSFVPCAKITEQGNYSIISDYLGTPIQAYNQQGELVWERELDIYGQTRKEKGISNFVPFRYQGQYYDEETNLCYNRFRYYDPESGTYISKDPISILGGLNVYAYVKDVNAWVDVLGLFAQINLPTTINLKTGEKHVLDRHLRNHPDWLHKSKWDGGKSDWKTITRDTFKSPDRIIKSGDRFIFEKVYKNPIGIDAEGNSLYKSRVVIEKNGDLVTAFPQKEFRKVEFGEQIIKCN